LHSHPEYVKLKKFVKKSKVNGFCHFTRKPESSIFRKFWTLAFAGGDGAIGFLRKQHALESCGLGGLKYLFIPFGKGEILGEASTLPFLNF